MIKHKLLELLPRTGIILIIGRRGAGKSVLAHALLEELHETRECYVYRFPKPEILPEYIKSTDNMEFKSGSVVVVDEGYMNFSARRGMSENNKFIDNLNGLARHKDLLIIYITQEAARIDINIVRGIEILMIKTLSINQVRFERKELRTLLTGIKAQFDVMPNKETLLSSVYVSCDTIDHKYEGMMIDVVTPAWYWTDNISKAWSDISLKEKSGENNKVNKVGVSKRKSFSNNDTIFNINGELYLVGDNGKSLKKIEGRD